MAQVSKTKADTEILISNSKDDKYSVLNAKAEKCELISGHNYWLIKKSKVYEYENIFMFYREIDSNQYIIRKGETLESVTVAEKKPDRKLNWLFVVTIVGTIFLGFEITEKKEEIRQNLINRPYTSCFDYLFDNLFPNWETQKIKDIKRFITTYFIVEGIMAVIFEALFIIPFSFVHITFLAPITITDCLYYIILIVSLAFVSFLITSIIKINNVMQKIKRA